MARIVTPVRGRSRAARLVTRFRHRCAGNGVLVSW